MRALGVRTAWADAKLTLTAPMGPIGTSWFIGARCGGPPSPGLRPTSPRRGEVVGTKSRWQIDFTSRKRRLDPSPALRRALDARLSRLKGAIRHPRSTIGGSLVTDEIDRHKARRMNGLRSSNLSFAHLKKSPRFGPSEMAKKTSEKTATHCHPLPFLWNSYMKLCSGHAGQPSRHPNSAGSLPRRFPGEPQLIIFPAAEIRMLAPKRERTIRQFHLAHVSG
jgi:hypothetical protein